MTTLREYYEKFVANKQKQIIDHPFDDPRTEEEKALEQKPFTGCSSTCVDYRCPNWDTNHNRRLFEHPFKRNNCIKVSYNQERKQISEH